LRGCGDTGAVAVAVVVAVALAGSSSCETESQLGGMDMDPWWAEPILRERCSNGGRLTRGMTMVLTIDSGLFQAGDALLLPLSL